MRQQLDPDVTKLDKYNPNRYTGYCGFLQAAGSFTEIQGLMRCDLVPRDFGIRAFTGICSYRGWRVQIHARCFFNLCNEARIHSQKQKFQSFNRGSTMAEPMSAAEVRRIGFVRGNPFAKSHEIVSGAADD